MRQVAGVLLLLALACAAFGWWGLSTAAGARQFEEMAGMIPFFAAVASGVLLLGAAVAWWLAGRRR